VSKKHRILDPDQQHCFYTPSSSIELFS
jgi:hypothetical protein